MGLIEEETEEWRTIRREEFRISVSLPRTGVTKPGTMGWDLRCTTHRSTDENVKNFSHKIPKESLEKLDVH